MNLYTIKIKRIVLTPVVDDITSISLSASDVEGEVFRSTIYIGTIGETADFRVGDVGCECQRVVAEIDATRIFTRRISSGRISHIGLNNGTIHVQCEALIHVKNVDAALGNSDDSSFVDGQLARIVGNIAGLNTSTVGSIDFRVGNGHITSARNLNSCVCGACDSVAVTVKGDALVDIDGSCAHVDVGQQGHCVAIGCCINGCLQSFIFGSTNNLGNILSNLYAILSISKVRWDVAFSTVLFWNRLIESTARYIEVRGLACIRSVTIVPFQIYIVTVTH